MKATRILLDKENEMKDEIEEAIKF